MGTIAAVASVLGHEVRFMYESALCKSICARCFMHMRCAHSSLLKIIILQFANTLNCTRQEGD